MKTLREVIHEADANHTAIGHFSFCNIETFWAIVNVARHLNLPIILGMTESERKFFGEKQAVELVRSVREEFNHPIFINADHTYSFDGVKVAVKAGFDSIIYDAAEKSLRDNIEETKQVVDFVRGANPDIMVEGELGYIGSSSTIHESFPEGVKVNPEALTTAEDAKKFVKETGVDLLAPAVGSIHGKLLHGAEELDIDRIKAIKAAVTVPLVLHGGSGIQEQSMRRSREAGISVIHITTEFRLAYRNTLRDMLIKFPDEIAPYKLMENVIFEMEKVAEIKLGIIANIKTS